jgi:hypothetical protein
MSQTQSNSENQNKPLSVRIRRLIKKEIKNMILSMGVTKTIGLGSIGIVVPMIFRISNKISEIISGDLLCENNISNLGVPKSLAKNICKAYYYLIYLFMSGMMFNLTYMYVFAETPTLTSFFTDYSKDLGNLFKSLGGVMSECTKTAYEEIRQTIPKQKLAKITVQDLNSLRLENVDKLFPVLTDTSIAFASNIGILTHVESVKSYAIQLKEFAEKMPSGVKDFTYAIGEYFFSSGNAERIIQNKDGEKKSLTDVKTLVKYNEDIFKTLDDINKLLGIKNFSELYGNDKAIMEMGKILEKRAVKDMGFWEKVWFVATLNSKHPLDTPFPILHEGIINATRITINDMIGGLQTSKYEILNLFGNTETFQKCKGKIDLTLFSFHKDIETKINIFDKAQSVDRSLFEGILPMVEIPNLPYSSKRSEIQIFNINPTFNGVDYNPVPDMRNTVNIVTYIVVIMMFIQFVIIPLLSLSKYTIKTVYKSVSKRKSPRKSPERSTERSPRKSPEK